jgi:spectinomycin phosphotransferase
MTDEQWKETGAIFKRIHQVKLPPVGFESLRKETFDPTEYARWIHTFEAQHVHEHSGATASQRALHSSWMAHEATISTVVTSLEKLAGVLQSRTFPYVICHADLHAANLIRDPAGHVFVIDWDEVMLAPKERDFIFIRQPQAEAFFQGYGQREIDWIALTYYLWERVVQDLIECAQNVCFKDDWGEEGRADGAQLFLAILEGGVINAAYAAAASLPSDLTVHTRRQGG